MSAAARDALALSIVPVVAAAILLSTAVPSDAPTWRAEVEGHSSRI
jgi:hypothetical protein